MRKAIIALMIVTGGLFASSAVLADSVEVEHSGPEIPLPIPQEHHDVVVEHRSSDCQTTTVHKENDEGDSKTVRKTDCD